MRIRIGLALGRLNDRLRRTFPALWPQRRWLAGERVAALFYDRPIR